MRIIDQAVSLIWPNDEQSVIQCVQFSELAGRTCYQSFDNMTMDSYNKFVSGLIKREHFSPIEFSNIILSITTSRDVMAELTRHRPVSFAVSSQRYVLQGAGGDIDFIRPQFVGLSTNTEDVLAYTTWRDACQASENAYKQMISHGAKKEDARKVLNNSVATEIMMGVNARELRHILKLRLSKAAYPEMRHLASLILAEVQQVPVLFDDILE